MPVTILHTQNGKLDEKDKVALQDLRQRLRRGAPNILLHLHGGLVDEASGLAAAIRLSGEGESAYNAPADWEQVYVIWRTGGLETLRTNWKDVFDNDRLYRVLFKRLISFIAGKVGVAGQEGRAVGAEFKLTPAEVQRRLISGDDQPFADIDAKSREVGSSSRASLIDDTADAKSELTGLLERDDELNTVAADIEATLNLDDVGATRSFQAGDAVAGRKTLDRVDDGIIEPWHTQIARGERSFLGGAVLKGLVTHGVAIGSRVIGRYRQGRDHGLHATIAEEIVRELYGDLIGSIVWGMMKGDASDHFAPGALGSDLLDIFEVNSKRRLFVSGHSAGSIWASEMLLAAAAKKIASPLDIVFLAPAVRTAKFAQALAASGSRIGKFRLFAMHDELERADALLGKGFGFLYPSSLLYFVSGLCEEHESKELADAPLLGMERFLAAESPWLEDAVEGKALVSVHAFLSQVGHRFVFSKSSAGAGLNSSAVSHGGFDDDPPTLASVGAMF
ncbi:hypothetical protein AB4037_07775 [Labrys sp. KB_33_2]|uniref:hypothetical protein n=1 Tax=Labrys sp. KB_33_2 TaxID=3237479 RepID=UPI003F8FFEC7